MELLNVVGRTSVGGTNSDGGLEAAVDAEQGLLLIKGAVPGPKGGLVFVRSTSKAVS